MQPDDLEDPSIGAGTRALMWALIALAVSGVAYIIGSGFYWIISATHG